MITDYHAVYYAHELSRIGGNGVDRFGRALFDACVDLKLTRNKTGMRDRTLEWFLCHGIEKIALLHSLVSCWLCPMNG